VIRILETAKGTQGDPKDYPHVGTTYRLTEHFHYWTKHVRLNNIVQPEQFVEIGEALGKETGHQDRREGQGFVQARLRQGGGRGDQAHQALKIDGKTIHHVGVPIHWGFSTTGRKGYHGQQPDRLRG
jgi:formate dehydrogenase major subunit